MRFKPFKLQPLWKMKETQADDYNGIREIHQHREKQA